MPLYHSDCRYFTGYKPCRFQRPCGGCPHHSVGGPRILIINVGALGAVLRATAILPMLRKLYPDAHITWLTQRRALPLLDGRPELDRILPFEWESQLRLEAEQIDLLLNADKDFASCALASRLHATEKRGFGLTKHGTVTPLNEGASYLYDTGLDNQLKFHSNQKTEPKMLADAFEIPYVRRPYTLTVPTHDLPKRLVGFNTGCSPGFPLKALDIDLQITAIRSISKRIGEPVLLLGGPEDTDRNNEIYGRIPEHTELSPTSDGLMVGAQHIDRCSVVFSGDSLGMHMAIAREKFVVAWFGLSCAQEIDLFDRGVKLTSPVSCGPCWKSSCDEPIKCNTLLPVDWIVDAVLLGLP